MYCKYCGNRIPDGSDRCPACGYTIEEEPKKEAAKGETPYDGAEQEEPKFNDSEERLDSEDNYGEEYVPFRPLSTKEYFRTAYDPKSALFIHVSFWIAVLIGCFFIFWTVFSWLRVGGFYTGLLTYVDTAMFVLFAAVLSRVLLSHVPAVIGCVLLAGNYLIARLFGGQTILVLAALMGLVYLAFMLSSLKKAKNHYNYCGLHSLELPRSNPDSEKFRKATEFFSGKAVLICALCIVLLLGSVGGAFVAFSTKSAEDRFSLGVWNGETYSNPYAGIEYEQEEGWSRYSDEKLYINNAQTGGVFADPYKLQMIMGINSNGYISGSAYCEVYLAKDGSAPDKFLNDMLASFEANVKNRDPNGKLEYTTEETQMEGKDDTIATFLVASGTEKTDGDTIYFRILIRRVGKHVEAFTAYGNTDELIGELLAGFRYTKP